MEITHKMAFFRQQMKKSNLPSSRGWVIDEERAGRLTMRRTPKGSRFVTDTDIKQIIKAYSYGGPGEWHYENV